MIRYADDTPAEVGDTILVDDDWTACVIEVVEDASRMRFWGYDDPGLMTDSEDAGLVFIPADQVRDGACKLISRSNDP